MIKKSISLVLTVIFFVMVIIEIASGEYEVYTYRSNSYYPMAKFTTIPVGTVLAWISFITMPLSIIAIAVSIFWLVKSKTKGKLEILFVISSILHALTSVTLWCLLIFSKVV